MFKKKYLIPSLVINTLIFVFVLVNFIFTWTGFKFMSGTFGPGGAQIMKYFTIQSNILMGLIALVAVIFEILILLGKVEKVPVVVRYLKHLFTVAVGVTFLVTATFLAPVVMNDFFSLYMDSNLFFHFLVPVLSIVTLIFFEPFMRTELRVTFFDLIPVVAYASFYMIVSLSHYKPGEIPPVPQAYDWYGFFKTGGLLGAIIGLTILVAATYGTGWLIWFFNRAIWKRSAH